MSSTLFQVTLVVYREGLEATLVIAAMAAYLNGVGSVDRLPSLYWGAALGLGGSLLFAWRFEESYGTVHDVFIRSALVFGATGLMLYVSGWLFIRQQDTLWYSYLRTRLDKTLTHQSGFATGVLAFLAVFREGVETAIFILAVPRKLGTWPVDLLGGIVCGAALLATAFFMFNLAARRMALRWSLLLTSLFLFGMALVALGEGIEILQDGHLLTKTLVPGGNWLNIVGLNPTWEALVLQFMTIILVGLGAAVLARQPIREDL